MRCKWCYIIAIFISVVTILGYVVYAARVKKPNVILISIDTLSADHMSVYGYTRKTTPNIDTLAKDSVIFTNAYTLFPVTPQSFYTLFTGREDFLKNSGRASENILEILKDPPFLAEILKKNNYTTSAFVNNPVLGEIYPIFRKGFQTFEFPNVQERKREIIFEDSYSQDHRNARLVTERSIQWLNKHKDQQIFTWIHYDTPHMPYNPPPQYVKKLEPNYNQKEYEYLLTDTAPYTKYLRTCSTTKPTNETLERAKLLYDAEVLSVDEQIGQLLQSIKELGLFDNSIIIIYSDHGEGFSHETPNHGYDLYNQSTHIALLVRYPRSTESKTYKGYISNVDIFCSIQKLLGITNCHSDGVDFSWVIHNTTSLGTVRDHILMRAFKLPVEALEELSGIHKYGIIENGYKYIHTIEGLCIGQSEDELFNSNVDKGETKNIAAENPDVVKKMKEQLLPYIRLGAPATINPVGFE